MTIMARTGIIPQLAHHTWIMRQTNCQKFSISLLFSKKILFLFKTVEHIIRQCVVHVRKSDVELLQFLTATAGLWTLLMCFLFKFVQTSYNK